MHEWQKGIFFDGTPLKSGMLYSAKFLGFDEFPADGKVRFTYAVIDENGEEQRVNRSLYINDRKRLKQWLNQHTDCDFSDPDMKDLKDAKHLVQLEYFNGRPYIKTVLPVDGDIHV